MSKLKVKGHISGTGSVTLEAPNTNSDVTLTLPDTAGEVLTSASSLDSSKLSGALPAIDGSALTGVSGGKILQVVQTHLTAPTSQSLTANTLHNISNLNASITPSSTSNKIRITVKWQGEATHSANHDVVFGINRNSTAVGNGQSAGSRPVGIAGIQIGYHSGDNDSTQDSAFYTYIDSPSTTSQVTYYATVKMTNSQTFYTSRTVGDGNGGERLTSTIILEEIAG